MLASVLPPADPYKQKPFKSLFGANIFTDVDMVKSSKRTQVFTKSDHFQYPGKVLKLQDFSALIFDIKRFNIETGEISDVGFAVQPLIHTLKDHAYLIGGKYQMPVFHGSMPKEILASMKFPVPDDAKPRKALKNLFDARKITQLGNMQLVSEVLDLHPPEDAPAASFDDRPSMLHHIDKTNLESHVIDNQHIISN